MQQWDIVRKALCWSGWYHPVLSGLPVNGHLSRVSRQSCLLANNTVDNETRGCASLLAFTLRLRKTPEYWARRPSDEVAHSTSGEEKEGHK